MKDTIIKGTGDSRYLKSAIPENVTHAQLVEMLRNGTFPIDLNGINEDGIEQLGTPLNTNTLLKDATAENLNIEEYTVDKAFERLGSSVLHRQKSFIDKPIYKHWVTSNRGNLYCIAYGNGVYVAAGQNKILYSTDGDNWTDVSVGSYSHYDVIFADNKFTLTSTSSANQYYSYDGVNWETFSMDIAPRFLCYGNGRYVALPNRIEGEARYSDDGINWFEADIPNLNTEVSGIAYGNGRFVASLGSAAMLVSNDGITWEKISTSRATTVAFCKGMFIAPVDSSNNYIYSYDGLAWQTGTLPTRPSTSYSYRKVVYDDENDKIIAIYRFGEVFAVSNDGITWSTPYKAIPTISDLWDATFGGGRFIMVGNSGTSGTSWGFAMTQNEYRTYLDITDTKDNSLLEPLGEAMGAGMYFIDAGDVELPNVSSATINLKTVNLSDYHEVDIYCRLQLSSTSSKTATVRLEVDGTTTSDRLQYYSMPNGTPTLTSGSTGTLTCEAKTPSPIGVIKLFPYKSAEIEQKLHTYLWSSGSGTEFYGYYNSADTVSWQNVTGIRIEVGTSSTAPKMVSLNYSIWGVK